MNKFITTLFAVKLFLLTTTAVFAQNEDTTANGESSKYVYCEMVGTQKLLNNKVTIVLDFGEAKSIWKDNRVKDEITGKAQSFNSMVDALNYMGEQGWEFAQAYVVTVGQQNVYHWLLKKKKEE